MKDCGDYKTLQELYNKHSLLDFCFCGVQTTQPSQILSVDICKATCRWLLFTHSLHLKLCSVVPISVSQSHFTWAVWLKGPSALPLGNLE